MARKAQVTLFVIIGILVVASIGGYFIISKGSFDSSKTSAKKFPEINPLVESCLEELTLDGIYFNSLQGGYYEVPEPKIDADFFEVPIYFDKEKRLPPLNVWENELSKYIKDNLIFCLNFSELEQKGYSFKIDEIESVRVSIKEKEIDVELKQPISISKEENNAQFKIFKKKINFNYVEKYNALNEFLNVQSEEPKWIPFTQTQNIGKKYGFYFETSPIEETTDKIDYIYEFKYLNTTKYKNEEYIFVFGVRYRV